MAPEQSTLTKPSAALDIIMLDWFILLGSCLLRIIPWNPNDQRQRIIRKNSSSYSIFWCAALDTSTGSLFFFLFRRCLCCINGHFERYSNWIQDHQLRYIAPMYENERTEAVLYDSDSQDNRSATSTEAKLTALHKTLTPSAVRWSRWSVLRVMLSVSNDS